MKRELKDQYFLPLPTSEYSNRAIPDEEGTESSNPSRSIVSFGCNRAIPDEEGTERQIWRTS